jgi:hypothetical protein
MPKLMQVYKKKINKVQAARNSWVSRPTLYEWIRKYEWDWIIWLIDESQWPKLWSKIWNKTRGDTEKIVLWYIKENILDGPKMIQYYLMERVNKNMQSIIPRNHLIIIALK